MQRRRSRAQRSIVVATAALAAASAGYVLGCLAAGFAVPDAALVVALAGSWLCTVALVAFPTYDVEEPRSSGDGTAGTARAAIRIPHPRRSTGHSGLRAAGPVVPVVPTDLAVPDGARRDSDPVSGLPRYDPVRDDRYVIRTGDLPGAVVVVEILDHVIAHAVATAVADRLVAEAAVRVSAIAATYGAVVRRLPGPQFVLLLPGLDEPALTALARMLHDGVAAGRVPGAVLREGSQPARLVAGVAVAPDVLGPDLPGPDLPGPDLPGPVRIETGEIDVAGLIRAAITATAQAKRLGSETPVFFHDRLTEEARERLVVGRALRTAIDERNINLVYQPVVDLVDGALLAVEVLARWHDPLLGVIAPDRFVRVAAELGMSWQLDRLVFEKAFAQLGDWDAAGVAVPRICVNVSPETIAEGRRVGLRKLLAAYSISAERVSVELVHSEDLDDELAAAAVRRYRNLGLQVTLDDFGAGEASFARLTALPVTGLKIDRSLLSGEPDPVVIGAIVNAGTSLGLAVGIVGIETRQQRDLLRELGCVTGQGYLYAHELESAELVEWLRVPHLVG